jgi:hypothetical protein
MKLGTRAEAVDKIANRICAPMWTVFLPKISERGEIAMEPTMVPIVYNVCDSSAWKFLSHTRSH